MKTTNWRDNNAALVCPRCKGHCHGPHSCDANPARTKGVMAADADGEVSYTMSDAEAAALAKAKA